MKHSPASMTCSLRDDFFGASWFNKPFLSFKGHCSCKIIVRKYYCKEFAILFTGHFMGDLWCAARIPFLGGEELSKIKNSGGRRVEQVRKNDESSFITCVEKIVMIIFHSLL